MCISCFYHFDFNICFNNNQMSCQASLLLWKPASSSNAPFPLTSNYKTSLHSKFKRGNKWRFTNTYIRQIFYRN